MAESFVFVSYSHDDAVIVQKLIDSLHKHGIDVWLDQHSLQPGTPDWEEAIRVAIESCMAFILIASPSSRKSRYVRGELDIAEVCRRTVLPFWVIGDEWVHSVPLGWGRTQNIDARAERFNTGVTTLIAAVKGITPIAEPDLAQPDVFLTYRDNTEPDETLVTLIEQALVQRGFQLTVDDQAIPLGTRGAQYIREAIQRARYMLCVLSEASSNSQVLEEEFKLLEQLPNPPVLLPIYLGTFSGLPNYLQGYLAHVPYILWQKLSDTPRLIEAVITVLEGGVLESPALDIPIASPTIPDESARPQPYISPKSDTGTMDASTSLYITREADTMLSHEMAKHGSTTIIKAPRQMGKSSLMIRGCQQAQAAGKHVVIVDMQLINSSMLHDESRLFKWFTRQIVSDLPFYDLPRLEDVWDDEAGSAFACTDYLEGYVLPWLEETALVIALDEADRLFESPFRSDFFGMLRSWHNNRSYMPLWQQLDLMLVISTEPNLLIQNLNQSPFNVGRVLTLTDFSLEQTAELNHRCGQPLDASGVRNLYALVGGHPYLTREALYQVSAGHQTLDTVLKTALHDTSIFADHLIHYLFVLTADASLEQCMRQVLNGESGLSINDVYRLQSAGLVRRTEDGVIPRCRLYELYFKKRLVL